jgi:hypothetical protein
MRSPIDMRKVFKNAAISATVSSAVVFVLSEIRRVSINVPYVWVWGAIAGVCYGWFALKLSIYGRAGVVLQNWKNGLLEILILVGILAVSVKIGPFVRAPAADPMAVALAASISMIVSDALEAPNQRWRSRYSRAKNVRE